MIPPRLSNWLDRPTTIYECSRCGTTVAGRFDACPYCDDSRIAVYEL